MTANALLSEGGTWLPVTTLSDLLRSGPRLCMRAKANGEPCRRPRMSDVLVDSPAGCQRFEPSACASHATAAERVEVAHAQALAEEGSRRTRLAEPVACWTWPVTDEHRRRSREANGCADAEDGWLLAMRLLRDWHDHRCAICGGRCEFTDHDHETANVRGLLCQSCNTSEAFAWLPGGCFDRYRSRNPAGILGLTIRYYSPITGWAEPMPSAAE